jgi:plastocyanin
MGLPETWARYRGGLTPAVALGLVLALSVAACGGTSPASATCRPNGTELHIGVTAEKSHAFDTDCLAAPVDQTFTIVFRNDDTSFHGGHNVAIYRKDGVAVFTGKGIGPGGTSILYEVQPLPAGVYTFRCDSHPNMRGTFIVGQEVGT